jgi:hypothetical protein
LGFFLLQHQSLKIFPPAIEPIDKNRAQEKSQLILTIDDTNGKMIRQIIEQPTVDNLQLDDKQIVGDDGEVAWRSGIVA